MKQRLLHRDSPSRARRIALLVAAALLPAIAGAGSGDEHTPHHHASVVPAHMGEGDHHDRRQHAEGHGDDPHAQHRRMLQGTGYARSEHAYELPDLPVVAMNGEQTSLLRELNSGLPVMVNFIFATCTTICPVMSASFTSVQQRLGAEAARVRMISVTIDPAHDTPERLREYAQRFGAGPQWQFLTGDLDDIIAIQKAFGVYRGNKMNHEPTTLMRAAEGEAWVRIDGIASAADLVMEYHRIGRSE